MNKFLSQLNLTPQERRTVVIIILVVFVVLNWVFVWPHFGDWGRVNKELGDMRGKEETYNRIIQQDRDPTNGWYVQVQKLAKLEGGAVTENAVDPQIQFQNAIRDQQRKTHVSIGSITPGTVKTNEFFEEHTTRISIESHESELVNFLYNMGNDPAMIRVSQLDLKPVDANRYQLKGGITLTANYAKKTPVQSSSAAVKSGPGSKSAGAPAGKPSAAPAPAQNTKHLPGRAPASGANSKPPPGSNPLLPTRPTRRPPPAQ